MDHLVAVCTQCFFLEHETKAIQGYFSRKKSLHSTVLNSIFLFINHLPGHAAISKALEPYGIGVATGEHCQNRVIFKQFFQARGFQFCQIDSCRMGGLNEVLAVLLMAAKFGGNAEFKKNSNPVCPLVKQL